MSTITYRARPFLRWAGGKSKIVHRLLKYVPVQYGRYWEPFLGAAALFFALSPTKAFLSDLNDDLIECYRQVRDSPQLVARYIRRHASKTCEKYYYQVRDKYNRGRPSAAQAARFIYLNKTSFNGIFRVNLKGEYNVPYGRKERPALPTVDDLCAASDLLHRSVLSAAPYEAALQSNPPQEGDFVYLDPPYPPINRTAYFTHYTASRFSWEDQRSVAEVAKTLDRRGVFVMISNTDTRPIRELYDGWDCHPLPVVRWIAANGTRHRVSELIITNYATELFNHTDSERRSR